MIGTYKYRHLEEVRREFTSLFKEILDSIREAYTVRKLPHSDI